MSIINDWCFKDLNLGQFVKTVMAIPTTIYYEPPERIQGISFTICYYQAAELT